MTLTADGINYEPGPGHMEKTIHELGLSDSKGAATPGVRDETTVSAKDLLDMHPHESRIVKASKGLRLLQM